MRVVFLATCLSVFAGCGPNAASAPPSAHPPGPQPTPAPNPEAEARAPEDPAAPATLAEVRAGSAPQRAGAMPPLPPECGEGEDRFWEEPEAPPPDDSAPRALVVEVVGELPDEHEALRRALREALPGHGYPPPVPVASLAAADVLVREARWSPDGPACRAAPPRLAVLARSHPNLVVARVEVKCVGGVCEFAVHPRRAGTTDREGLPPALDAVAPDGNQGLVLAVPELQPITTAAGMLGVVATGGVLARTLERTSADAFLRVSPALYAARFRFAEACLPAGAAASLALAWDVAPDGSTARPRVEPRAVSPAVDATVLAQCVRDELAELGWRCPRSGQAEHVEALYCLARRSPAATAP